MNTLARSLYLALIITALSGPTFAMAGVLSLTWSTDKEPVSYLPGETMTFRVQLLEDGKPLAGKTLKWTRTGDDQKTEAGTGTSSEHEPVEITTSLESPGFVHLTIMVMNPDGSPVMAASDKRGYVTNDTTNHGTETPAEDARLKPVKFEGGAGASVEKLAGDQEPTDFDAFWTAQKTRLKDVPLKADLKEVPSANPEFTAYDVKLDCAGGKPVSGYLSVPKDAKEKSLPAIVTFNGYGVSPAGQGHRRGKITLNINAHGIENGREPEYYKALSDGELKGYVMSNNNNENDKPETCYFNGMALRVLRALEYMKSRPEWDGRTLVVLGGSQGGLQALWGAALDHDVTECHASMPWCCHLGESTPGRIRGWLPKAAPGLPYYDAIFMGKRIRCMAFIEAGLGDSICVPSGVSILYNNIVAKKKIVYIQGASHVRAFPDSQRQIISAR